MSIKSTMPVRIIAGVPFYTTPEPVRVKSEVYSDEEWGEGKLPFHKGRQIPVPATPKPEVRQPYFGDHEFHRRNKQ